MEYYPPRGGCNSVRVAGDYPAYSNLVLIFQLQLSGDSRRPQFKSLAHQTLINHTMRTPEHRVNRGGAAGAARARCLSTTTHDERTDEPADSVAVPGDAARPREKNQVSAPQAPSLCNVPAP